MASVQARPQQWLGIYQVTTFSDPDIYQFGVRKCGSSAAIPWKVRGSCAVFLWAVCILSPTGKVCSPLKIRSWPPKIGVPGVQMHLKPLPRTDSTIEWRTWRVQNGWETSGGKNKSCWKISNFCGFHSSFATGPSYSHYLGLSGNRVAKFTIIIHNSP